MSLETPYPLRFEHTSTEFLLKIRKSIESCVSLQQLVNLKKFVKMYWDNMMYVGLQGFVAMDLKNQYIEKLKQLTVMQDLIDHLLKLNPLLTEAGAISIIKATEKNGK